MPQSPDILVYGREKPKAERLALRAGPLEMVWEQGALRWVRLGRTEVLRHIYVAVRDVHWGTVPGQLSELQVQRQDDCFALSCQWRHREGGIDFSWRSRISGASDGTVTFEMDGQALADLATNRTGCCVLHPATLAGRPYRQVDSAGRVTHGRLPSEVSPHQPLTDIRSLSVEVLPGLWAKVGMEGGPFEMEDQRNWTDASFKTYAPPLVRSALPLRLSAGQRLRQVITLKLEGTPTPPAISASADSVQLSLSRDAGWPLTRLGIALSAQPVDLSEREIARLRALRLHHLRVELPLVQDDWPARLQRAANETRRLGVPLEAAVVVPPQPAEALDRLGRTVACIQPPVWAWLLLREDARPVGAETLAQARSVLQPLAPKALFGSGSGVDYVEMNREHPPETIDLACFGLCPQVHVFDDDSLMETLPMQGLLARDARRIVGAKPLLVSPITLRRRFEPAMQPFPATPDATGRALLPQADPRQAALWGAAWTLGSLASLAESEVAFATYYETAGWIGVQDTAAGPTAPAGFHARASGVYPLYHVLAWLSQHADSLVRQARSTDPQRVAAMALARGPHLELLVANLTDQAQKIRLPQGSQWLCTARLNARTVERAMHDPEGFAAARPEDDTACNALILSAYECLRLESEVR